MALFGKLFDKNDWEIRKARKIVEKINALEPEVQKMSFLEMKNYIQ